MQIATAHSPQQLLLAVPHLVGQGIARSVVLLPFRRGRTGMAARCDIPHLDRRALVAWADHAVATMLDARADALAVVIVTDRVIGAEALPHRALARALSAAARRVRLPVVARLCQAADAWGDYLQPSRAQGPLAELEVTDGLPFLPPTAPPAVPTRSSPERRSAVAAALETTSVASRPVEAEPPEWIVERALADPTLTPETAAVLLSLLADASIRDATTVQLLDGFDAGVQAHALQHGDVSATEPMRLLGFGDAPDRDRVELGIGLVERLVADAPDALRCDPLVVLGTLHWLVGRSGTATACIGAALALDPEHGMGSLLATVLDAGMLPDWVRADRDDAGA